MADLVDIKLFFEPNETGYFADMRMGDGDVITDDWIRTAIKISLGTNQRVNSVDRTDNGWWAENLIGHNLGSKLFLLDRSKAVNTTLRLAEQYTKEALAWLEDDRHVAKIENPTAEAKGGNRVQINAIIRTHAGDLRRYRYLFTLED